jgi:alpha,alpha-trehalose phosphorylase
MEQALAIPMEEHYRRQRDYLKEFWDNCFLEIKGDDALTEAVNYNMYQLVQSVGKDEYCNIAAKGLSGEGYEGHYFWDTEMYIQPFFNLTEASITKNLIGFRYSTLEKARENAKILGHKKGALYPWRTIMGVECSGYFPSGTAAYHINGDIAYSIIAYYLTTKDLDFIAKEGAEIIFETARLWLDVGNYYQGTFRINEVTGPDEYTCMVNNNYFTNAAAQYNLKWAVKFYEILKAAGMLNKITDKIGLSEKEIEEFRQAEENMYLPYDDDLGINPQDDSFLAKKVWDIDNTPQEDFPLLLHYHPLHLYRHQVCKQADTVLAHFIFEDAQSIDTIRKSFAYYEKVTTHDSSLSTCIFSIVASKLGLVDKAYDYFGDSAKLDLFNTHKNTKDGIHTANMGGNFMAIVYGFGGLRIKESGICFAPVIPSCWEEYSFQINYEDSQIRVRVKKEECSFALMKGSVKTIKVFGKSYELKEKINVPI